MMDNSNFQEFLGRINEFQETCYSKIDAMKQAFDLDHPVIELNTDSSKLFMANGAIIDSENTIKEGYKLLKEFNNFDLNDNEISQCYGFFKSALQCLEETCEKVKIKYEPAISTYKTLIKTTSRNSVYTPSEISDDEAANTTSNVKTKNNGKDDVDENDGITVNILIVLIIIGIIILILLKS